MTSEPTRLMGQCALVTLDCKQNGNICIEDIATSGSYHHYWKEIWVSEPFHIQLYILMTELGGNFEKSVHYKK